jgi:hypothetical protein
MNRRRQHVARHRPRYMAAVRIETTLTTCSETSTPRMKGLPKGLCYQGRCNHSSSRRQTGIRGIRKPLRQLAAVNRTNDSKNHIPIAACSSKHANGRYARSASK